MAPSFTRLFTLLAAASAVFAAPAPAPEPHAGGRGGSAVSAASAASAASRILGVPVVNPSVRNAIPNAYIVVYNRNMTDDIIDTYQANVMGKIAKRNVERRELHKRSSLPAPVDTTMRSFRVNGFRAMALRDTDDLTMVDIFNADEVAYIEQDARVEALAVTTQTDATSGLSRLSRAAVDTAGATSGAFSYAFDSSAGTGITAYIVDTGIQANHDEFEGRATFGANFANTVDTDENGHGTHVAGTIGGRTFGVAKNVQLIGVKVLDADGAGTNSDVLAGMNWVAANATATGRSGTAVLNMSLGGSRSRAINAAIDGLVAAGVVPVVAAGNENEDAINSSPASARGTITVGAIDQLTDRKASFSNFGATVDIFAPGVKVLSSSISSTSTSETAVLSGTSMASPHVAGLAAYLMSLEGLTDGAAVLARMVALADASGAQVKNNVAGTTNRIANNGQL